MRILYRPVIYYQTDARWKNVPYAVRGESSTLGGSGCGPTSMAMVLATWVDKNVTPATECAWALRNGYKAKNQGTYYSYFVPAAKRYNLKCTRVNTESIYGNNKSSCHDTAKKAIENNHLVIACMGKGLWTKSGHYILVYNIQGNTIYINDPASSRVERTQGDYSLFKKQVKYYWIIENPSGSSANNFPGGVKIEDVYCLVKVLDKTGLNCRTGYGMEYPVIKTFPYLATLRITKKSSNGWGYVENTGWVNLFNTQNLVGESDLNMTRQEFLDGLSEKEAYQLYTKAMSYAAKLPTPDWAVKEGSWKKAESMNIIHGDPERLIKRDESVAILYRLGLLDK